ncbi:MAG: hypothetical protein ACRCZP_16215, partial [Phycicoccus sp.]
FGLVGRSDVIPSPRRLSSRINLLRRHRGDVHALVEDGTSRGQVVDRAIDDHLCFVQDYARSQVPIALAALETIGRDVLGARASISATSTFADELENLFGPPYTVALEELGLPQPLVATLSDHLDLEDAAGLDDVLGRLTEIDGTGIGLHPFELEMLRDTQANLGPS